MISLWSHYFVVPATVFLGALPSQDNMFGVRVVSHATLHTIACIRFFTWHNWHIWGVVLDNSLQCWTVTKSGYWFLHHQLMSASGILHCLHSNNNGSKHFPKKATGASSLTIPQCCKATLSTLSPVTFENLSHLTHLTANAKILHISP